MSIGDKVKIVNYSGTYDVAIVAEDNCYFTGKPTWVVNFKHEDFPEKILRGAFFKDNLANIGDFKFWLEKEVGL